MLFYIVYFLLRSCHSFIRPILEVNNKYFVYSYGLIWKIIFARTIFYFYIYTTIFLGCVKGFPGKISRRDGRINYFIAANPLKGIGQVFEGTNHVFAKQFPNLLRNSNLISPWFFENVCNHCLPRPTGGVPERLDATVKSDIRLYNPILEPIILYVKYSPESVQCSNMFCFSFRNLCAPMWHCHNPGVSQI